MYGFVMTLALRAIDHLRSYSLASAIKRTRVARVNRNRCAGTTPRTAGGCGFLIVLLMAQVALADKIRILEDPNESAQARVDLIQQAKHSVDAQYYIVGDDYFTLAGLALLRDAARRGCEVRLIIDGRSNKLSSGVHAHLNREHVFIKLYHPVRLDKLFLVSHRMHDKGLNIDHRCMIRGGRNVEGDYFGYEKRNYVDRDVYVEGKGVKESVAYFDRLWNSEEVSDVIHIHDPQGTRARDGGRVLDEAWERLRTGKKPRVNTHTNWSTRAREVSPVEFLYDPVGRKDVEFGIAQNLRQKLLRTRHSVLIETPYLVPTKELLADLIELKKRGVTQIEMVTNSTASNDDMLVALGYEAGKKKLLQLGVDLWEYKGPNSIHAKSAVLDNKMALIGSFNIDPRSQHLNTETGVAISDEKIALELRRYIDVHKTNCTRITADQLRATDQSVPLSASQRFKVSILKMLLLVLRGQL